MPSFDAYLGESEVEAIRQYLLKRRADLLDPPEAAAPTDPQAIVYIVAGAGGVSPLHG